MDLQIPKGGFSYIELYQGVGMKRSAAIQSLFVLLKQQFTGHFNSKSRATVLILVVTLVTDCRGELIQYLVDV